MTSYTHMYEMQLGVDLTNILSPENIPGIKAYLGVNSNEELLEAVAKDQYNKIESAIKGLGMGVISAKFTKVNTPNDEKSDDKDNSNSDKNTLSEDFEQLSNVTKIDKEEKISQFETINEQIVAGIKPVLKNKNIKEVSTVTINAEFINYVEGSEALHKASGLNEDTVITFDELDEDTLMIVSYIDEKGSLKHNKIKFKKTIN